jgi:hypothetical protein
MNVKEVTKIIEKIILNKSLDSVLSIVLSTPTKVFKDF